MTEVAAVAAGHVASPAGEKARHERRGTRVSAAVLAIRRRFAYSPKIYRGFDGALNEVSQIVSKVDFVLATGGLARGARDPPIRPLRWPSVQSLINRFRRRFASDGLANRSRRQKRGIRRFANQRVWARAVPGFDQFVFRGPVELVESHTTSLTSLSTSLTSLTSLFAGQTGRTMHLAAYVGLHQRRIADDSATIQRRPFQ